ncbi:hypothetical protein BS47DRAFT_633987 [Hydnum rufescens UP504]|uniref:Uncharacterized protein n=1 Tax=Hydnum rufescens UP504 TaxID=1448309 RepID=A0A9P6E217_9AGAM|nr:hypothetical protein BS47DRAFT_633987 [Hydnum rufescens UP504]
MSLFFRCLKPAPALPPSISDNLLQPQGLKLTLLPFQRKSVFWMLGREGHRSLMPTVLVVPATYRRLARREASASRVLRRDEL